MVELTVMKGVYHKLARIAKAFKNFESFIVNAMGAEVLRNSTVVIIGQPTISVGFSIACSLCRLAIVMEQILDIYDIDVPNLLHRVCLLLSQ